MSNIFNKHSTGKTIVKFYLATIVIVGTTLFSSCSKSSDSKNSASNKASVYIAGYVSNGMNEIAALWKDGVVTRLTDGSQDASASSVFVSGNDVYVAGQVYNGTAYVARYGKIACLQAFLPTLRVQLQMLFLFPARMCMWRERLRVEQMT